MVKWPLPVRIPRLRALEPPQIVAHTFRTSSEVAKTCDVEPFRILVLERDLGDAADASALGPVVGRLLPHRYRMLLLDRGQHLSSTTARGYKTVSANEPWCSTPGGRLPSTIWRGRPPRMFAVNPLLRCVFDSLVPVAVHR